MILEIICGVRRLVDFQEEWSCFARTIDYLTPFQLPEWLLTWWKHFGNGQLHVLVFRERETVVGVIPCFRHCWEGRRQITLIGSGISDYLEPAIRPEHSSAIVERLRLHLEDEADWDVCNWQDLSAETPLQHLTCFPVEVSSDTECSEIRLSGSFDEYWRGRPKSLRQNVRRDKQKAESLDRLEFTVVPHADADAMEALIQLHTARWHKHGEPGMIEANRSAGFLRDIACEFSARDLLRLFVLRFAGRIGAVIFGFHYRGTLFNYLTAFDPEYEDLGLGRTLLFEGIRYAWENGYTAWNFLRGDEPYKSWWGAEKISKRRVVVDRKMLERRR